MKISLAYTLKTFRLVPLQLFVEHCVDIRATRDREWKPVLHQLFRLGADIHHIDDYLGVSGTPLNGLLT